MKTPTITVSELAVELAGPEAPRILDVREPSELRVSAMPGAINIPLGELPSRLAELDASQNWVVLCRAGIRSGHATNYLVANGFERVRNILGGLNAWSKEIDPRQPIY